MAAKRKRFECNGTLLQLRFAAPPKTHMIASLKKCVEKKMQILSELKSSKFKFSIGIDESTDVALFNTK